MGLASHPDEGTYLYQAWRVSLGEFPYRDFLTPQLPVFLGLGGLLFRLAGPSLLAIRLLTLVTMLSAAALVYVLGARLTSPRAALFGLVLFLTQDGVYEMAREYRPEAYMLFFGTAGLVASLWLTTENSRRTAEGRQTLADYKTAFRLPPSTLHLPLAGIFFGLATMSKLFGFLPLAGCGLFVLYLGLSRRLSFRQVGEVGLWLGVPFVLVVAAIVGGALDQAPNFFDAILLHHLRQGSDLPRAQVILKAVVLYWNFLTKYPALVVLVLAGMWSGWRRRRSGWTFLAWQIPTALTFIVLSRDLRVRHLMYLLPALCPLAGLALENFEAGVGLLLLNGPRRRGRSFFLENFEAGVGLLLLIAAILPPMGRNLSDMRRSDPATPAVSEYIQQNTQPDRFVIADFARFNFYARRKTVYSAASLSSGATMSGQISGNGLSRQMAQAPVEMVLMNPPGGFFTLMRDYLDFRHYVLTHFHFDRMFERADQRYRIYRSGAPVLRPHPIRFGDQLDLRGSALDETRVESGGIIYLTLGWQAVQTLARDYMVFIHLADERGHLWAIRDQELRDEDGNPPAAWTPGTPRLDAYGIQVMPGTPLGRYQLRIGVYPREEPGHPLDGRALLPFPLEEGPDEGQHGGQNSTQMGTWIGPEVMLGEIEIVKAVTSWWVFAPSPIENDFTPEPVFGNRLALVGFSGGGEAVRPGDTIHITAFWRALEAAEDAYRARFEIRDAQGDLWPAGDHALASDAYPPNQWIVRDIVAGQYDLVVAGGVAPGHATLQLSVTGADGLPLAGPPVALFSFEIQPIPRVFEVPPLQHPLSVTLGDQVELLGYNLPETRILAGKQIPLTLVWRGRKPIDTSYKVFTHLLDSQNKIWGQQDNVPVMGARPTTGWAPGEVIVDEYSIPVAPDAPAGTYSLEVGLYDPATGRRLDLHDAQQALIGDHLVLIDISVDRR